MLGLTGVSQIYLYRGVTDMRKSFDGLSGLVEAHFPERLLSGALFIFCNRRRDRIKVMYWDGDGFALWYKRLEKGRFRLPRSAWRIAPSIVQSRWPRFSR
jgi:transposase